MTLPLFPSLPGLTYPIKRTPVWNVDQQDAVSGARTRLQLSPFPSYHYELTYSVLRAANAYQELQTMLGFFHQRHGATDLFQFNDPADDTATNQSFGTGDGTTKAFQLERSRGSFVEPVFVITAAALSVAGVPQVLGVDYTLSDSGLVAFTAAPALGAALSWTGTYNWPCRFDDDAIELSLFMNLLHELKTIKFSTEFLFTSATAVSQTIPVPDNLFELQFFPVAAGSAWCLGFNPVSSADSMLKFEAGNPFAIAAHDLPDVSPSGWSISNSSYANWVPTAAGTSAPSLIYWTQNTGVHFRFDTSTGSFIPFSTANNLGWPAPILLRDTTTVRGVYDGNNFFLITGGFGGVYVDKCAADLSSLISSAQITPGPGGGNLRSVLGAVYANGKLLISTVSPTDPAPTVFLLYVVDTAALTVTATVSLLHPLGDAVSDTTYGYFAAAAVIPGDHFGGRVDSAGTVTYFDLHDDPNSATGNVADTPAIWRDATFFYILREDSVTGLYRWITRRKLSDLSYSATFDLSTLHILDSSAVWVGVPNGGTDGTYHYIVGEDDANGGLGVLFAINQDFSGGTFVDHA